MQRILATSVPAGTIGALLLVLSGGAAAQGTEFNLSCAANEALVGISGRQHWWMEGIAARCRVVEADGALGAAIRTTRYSGGSRGAASTFDCLPAEVMVGYSGVQADNGYVLHVHEIVCAPWQTDTRTAGAETRKVGAFAEKAGSGRAMTETCSEGRVGTRLRGRAGQYLDSLIDMGCSHMAGGTRPLAANGVSTHLQRSAEPDTRAIRPTATLTTRPSTRPSTQPAGIPAITLASPRSLVLKIGSSYRLLKLSGTHLQRVTQAAVVDADGEVAGGFDVRVASRHRTDDRLSLSIIAGMRATPGNYRLRLSYELDDPRPQTSPRASRRRPVVRTVMVPGRTVTIRPQAMSARLVNVSPESPQIGREYATIHAAVADLPGKDVVSVTRFPYSASGTGYCDFEGTYHSPDESLSTAWQGAHNLEIRFSPGRLIPRSNADTCRLRFSLRTTNELGDEFYSVVDTFVRFQPADPDTRKAYPVSNTWDLKRYLGFELQPYSAVGMCSGTSPGTSGLIPVGVVKVGNDTSLRIRSGPIGTKCTWMIYATGLRSGWEMRMRFDQQPVGNKCDTGVETSAGGSFKFDRLAGLYHHGGVLTLSVNNPQGEIPPYDPESAAKYFRYINLSCGPTLTNDHGVTMRMVSAELVGNGGPSCTWKCGVTD